MVSIRQLTIKVLTTDTGHIAAIIKDITSTLLYREDAIVEISVSKVEEIK